MNIVNLLCYVGEVDFEVHMYLVICCPVTIIAGSLESAYSLIWGSHKIWGKGGGDTLDLL